MNRSDMARFFSKVRVSDSGCWEWTGSRQESGYGWFWLGRGKATTSHRASYTAFVGPVPAGLTLDHLCANTRCCNPSHLEAVTALENVRRAAARRTHCRHGHPFTGEHLMLRERSGRTHRECLTCHRAQAKAWMRAHRARKAQEVTA